jgi:hypothetical protein
LRRGRGQVDDGPLTVTPQSKAEIAVHRQQLSQQVALSSVATAWPGPAAPFARHT